MEQEEIQKMPNLDVIEPAQSEWAAPIVFRPKKTDLFVFASPIVD